MVCVFVGDVAGNGIAEAYIAAELGAVELGVVKVAFEGVTTSGIADGDNLGARESRCRCQCPCITTRSYSNYDNNKN